MNDAPHPEFRNTTLLTLGLIGAVAGFVVMSEIGIWSGLQEIQLLNRARAGQVIYDDWAYANTQRQALVGGLLMLAFFTSAALFVRWVAVSNSNAHRLTSRGMQFGPRSTALWFFVPVANLWKPYQAVREIFRASHPEFSDNWKKAPVPRFLSLWWTLWLVLQLIVVTSLATDLLAPTVDHLLLSASLSTMAGVLSAPLGVATSICVWRLNAWQRAKWASMGEAHPTALAGPWPVQSGAEATQTPH